MAEHINPNSVLAPLDINDPAALQRRVKMLSAMSKDNSGLSKAKKFLKDTKLISTGLNTVATVVPAYAPALNSAANFAAMNGYGMHPVMHHPVMQPTVMVVKDVEGTGRKKGSKDKKPRKRRTKAEMAMSGEAIKGNGKLIKY